jgi:GrpB-like predicted nucleotidyltransferase (UPF0157 family)
LSKWNRIGAATLAAVLSLAPFAPTASAAAHLRAQTQQDDAPSQAEQDTFNRGRALFAKGQFEQAAAVFRDFLKANPNTDPENNQFKALRRGLAEHLKGVASRTREEFGDPWGLVAMDLATARGAKARAQVTGPRVAFLRTRGGE